MLCDDIDNRQILRRSKELCCGVGSGRQNLNFQVNVFEYLMKTTVQPVTILLQVSCLINAGTVMDTTLRSSSIISPVFLLLLALPSNPSASPTERCNISRDGHLDDDICLISSYANSTGLNDSAISSEDIEFILRDRTSGVLEVRFPILKKYFAYDLRLNVVEYIKKQEECNNVHLNNTLLHSIRQFDVFSCKDDLELDHCDSAPACTKFTSVIFSHVFGGCYLLHITPKNNSSSGQPTMCRKLIDSEHNKTVIWDKTPSVADQSYPDDHMARITFAYALLHELPVSLTLVQGVNQQEKQHCSKTGHKHSCCYLDNNTLLQCESIKDGYYHPYCELVSNHSDSLNSIACTFYNMTPGQYCVILEPIDRDRCQPGTVWTNGLEKTSPCKYQHTFNFRKRSMLNHTPVPRSDNHNNNILVVIGSVGALTALVILGLAMYSGLHYSFPGTASTDLSSRNTEEAVSKMNSKPHVLLLYAQDCQPFMKLMCTFRSLLSHVGKCEVLDFFDPECAEYVAPAPEDWMLKAVSSCRVIIVINDCGVELQKKSSLIQSYRYPQPFTHLFLVGLKHIMGSPSREYCRVFVVRFDNQDMNFITPHIRFLLPHNLCDLLGHLNPSCDTRILDECKDDQKLKDDIQEFLLFKKENPNYMKSLMILENNL